MCKKIIFVGCGKSKKQYKCKAKDMYTGRYFQTTYGYALFLKNKYPGSQICILSAKYGILNPNTEIIPYEKTLTKMNKQEKADWYEVVREQMKQLDVCSLPKIFVCGKIYQGSIIGENVFPKGLGMGSQMKFLKQKMDRKRKALL